MRKETREILASLKSSYPKRALMGLWTDLRVLSKEEFETAIKLSAKPGIPRRRKNAPITTAVSDGPAARIAQLMLEKCALSPLDAVQALRQHLVKQRIAETGIPAMQGSDFEG